MNKKEITVQLNLDTTEVNKQLEQIRKKIKVMITDLKNKKDNCVLRLELANENFRENIAFGYTTSGIVTEAKQIREEIICYDGEIKALQKVLKLISVCERRNKNE